MSKIILAIIIVVVVLGGIFIYIKRHRNTLVAPTNKTDSYGTTNKLNTSSLPWIKTQGNKFIDQNNKIVLLRGFVTLTDNNPFNSTSFDYTLSDYQRMNSLGANIQSIRVGVSYLGGVNGKAVDQNYIRKLENMVDLAQQSGIYTEFKLTMYDESGFVGTNSNTTWTMFWNSSQEQQQIINDWMIIWQDFKNDPAVVGYDLLNEPEKGELGVDDNTFTNNYLNPFYQKTIDGLKQIDQNHLAFFQPGYVPGQASYMNYNATVSKSGIVYAPHFYPGYIPYLAQKIINTSDYGSWMQKYLSEAQKNDAPLFIGEYAMPWNPGDDNNLQLQNAYQATEKAAINLFIQNNLSFTRPWYADDRAQVNLNRGGRTFILSHALIQGNSLSGSFRTFITDIFSQAVKGNKIVN